MIPWLVALPDFLTISSVCTLVHILSLVVPSTVCLLVLGASGLSEVQIAKCKSQYQYAYWKVLTPELLELGALFLNC